MVEKTFKAARRTKIADLFKNVIERCPAYTGAAIRTAPDNCKLIEVNKSITDLTRYKALSHKSSYLYQIQEGKMLKLNSMQQDSAGSDVKATSISKSGKNKIIVRGGDKPDSKDLFFEVWAEDSAGGFQSSLKVDDKVTSLYRDVVFGSISWSKDETKVCFIGEVPPTAKFKSPYENKEKKEESKEEKKEEEPKEESKEEKKEPKKEEEKEEHWLDEKFLHERDFGEMLVGKKKAGLFVFDLKENQINQVQGLPD